MKKIDPTLEADVRNWFKVVVTVTRDGPDPTWDIALTNPEIEPLLLEYVPKMELVGLEFIPMIGLLICDPNNPRYREMLKTKELPYDDDEIDDIIREYHKDWQPCKTRDKPCAKPS